MTRDAQCYLTRQSWLAIRLAANDAKTEPEAIVDAALTEYFAAHHPTVAARAEAYHAATHAAWKQATKGAQ